MASIAGLINNLQREYEEFQGSEKPSILNLVVNNSFDYDSDYARQLILQTDATEFKSGLHAVCRQISASQFSAIVKLKQLAAQEPVKQPVAVAEVETAKPTVAKPVASGRSVEGDNLAELRNRLLSRRSNALDLSKMSLEGQNDAHQARQDSLLGDMLGLVGQLKENVNRFNEALETDTAVLKDTTKGLEKVGSAAGQIGQRLKLYNQRGKLGFWFYIYVTVGLVVVPLVMLFIIRLVPRF